MRPWAKAPGYLSLRTLARNQSFEFPGFTRINREAMSTTE